MKINDDKGHVLELDPEKSKKLEALAIKIDDARDSIAYGLKEIRSNALHCLTYSIKCGQYLCEAKELLDHGHWLGWLKEYTSLSIKTAERYMALAEKVKSSGMTNFKNLTEAYRWCGIIKDDGTPTTSDHGDPEEEKKPAENPKDKHPHRYLKQRRKKRIDAIWEELEEFDTYDKAEREKLIEFARQVFAWARERGINLAKD